MVQRISKSQLVMLLPSPHCNNYAVSFAMCIKMKLHLYTFYMHHITWWFNVMDIKILLEISMVFQTMNIDSHALIYKIIWQHIVHFTMFCFVDICYRNLFRLFVKLYKCYLIHCGIKWNPLDHLLVIHISHVIKFIFILHTNMHSFFPLYFSFS